MQAPSAKNSNFNIFRKDLKGALAERLDNVLRLPYAFLICLGHMQAKQKKLTPG